MRTWLRRIRGAIGMGLTWAAAGALVGFLMEIFVDPNGAIIDIWPAALALPAFLSGAGFSTVLGIAARRRRFDELSLPQFAAWGAVGGMLVGLIPGAMVALGLARLTNPAENVWLTTAMLSATLGVLSAVSASASLALARSVEDGELGCPHPRAS